MNNSDLLYFWKICVDRRKFQLEMLNKSLAAIQTTRGTRYAYTQDDLTYNEKLACMRSVHGDWIREQEDKVKHAENMVKFFEGTL